MLPSASLNKADYHNNNGDDQQDMDDSTHRVTGYQAEGPQNYQYHCNGPQHVILLSKDSPASRGIHLDYSMVIRFFTLFTPFTSLTSLVARSFSVAFFALPPNVTTPFFVVTEVLRALVER